MTPDVRTLKRKKIVHHSSSSEDDTPLQASSPAKNAKSAAVPMPGAIQATTVPHANGKAKVSKHQPLDKDSDYDDDVPIAKKKRASNGVSKAKPPKKRMKKEESEDERDIESEDDKPIIPKKAVAPKKGKRKMQDVSESDGDDEGDDKPLKKPATSSAGGGRFTDLPAITSMSVMGLAENRAHYTIVLQLHVRG